jgi:hypothetical protein
MRILFLLLFFFFSAFAAHALTRPELDALLREKGLSVSALELKGLTVVMGEVTGHLTAVPFSRVAILVTANEAILRSEIEAVDGGPALGGVVSVRFQGQYVLRRDVRATVLAP